MVADLRADLHNTSAKDFGQLFRRDDFLPAATEGRRDVEAEIEDLVAQGKTRSAAAAAVFARGGLRLVPAKKQTIDATPGKPVKRTKRAG